MESSNSQHRESRFPEDATGGEKHCMASHCTLDAKVESTQPTQIPQKKYKKPRSVASVLGKASI
jgi:hypothetical protein